MPEPLFSPTLSHTSSSMPDELRTELPISIQDAICILPNEQQELIKLLYIEYKQAHLFDGFTTQVSPSVRRMFGLELYNLHLSYADGGGLPGYIKNARRLLDDSRRGANPYLGWIPTTSVGNELSTYRLGTDLWKKSESVGIEQLGATGFVLVAGGLGERLGYTAGLKIGLPTEMTTETCYLHFYCEYILAVQKRYCFGTGKYLPLCIMTSKDTHDKTVELLKVNNYFNMNKDQITLVQQGMGVPALIDNDARIALNNGEQGDTYFKVVTKPHGHGDIHNLLYKHQVAKKWYETLNIKWITIFQDTNGLAFHTLPLMLGHSIKNNLIMNSLCVPRQAKQAIGAIVRLKNTTTNQIRTINVEYNQLDSLLRSAGYANGDVNDPNTGYSPFPGNINQLVFALGPYVETLEKTKGMMPEFVNPKYKDETKTEFKSPTRLECMMQDFPIMLEDNAEYMKRVGFTTVAADLCFSPVKNNIGDGKKLQESGIAPATASTGEADQYNAQRIILRSIGVNIEDSPMQVYNGIQVVPGPAIVLKPDFVQYPGDYFDKFPFPSNVRISNRSTLVVRGSGVVIESLDVDGTCIIDYPNGEKVTIRDKVVRNAGWKRIRNEQSDTNNVTNEIIRIRGYYIEKIEQETVTSDGSCTMCCIM